MRINNFNYMFFSVLVCLSFALLYSSWSYYQAEKIINDNHNRYEGISQEQEYQFNTWDLERSEKVMLLLGLLFFAITIIYLIMSISFYQKIKSLEVNSK